MPDLLLSELPPNLFFNATQDSCGSIWSGGCLVFSCRIRYNPIKGKLLHRILFQPIKVENYSDFFVALGKALFHGFGKQFDESLLDIMDAIAALGLEETDDRLTWKLVNRSVMQAISSLVKNNKSSIPVSDETSFVENIKKLKYDREIKLDSDFFNRPKECQFVKDIQVFLHEWLSLVGVEDNKAKSIVNRFPGFFVYSLRDEWAGNSNIYIRLLAETPFSDSVVMEDDWERYRAWLGKQTQESVFDEAFSLSQIYVPLCAFYETYEERNNSHNLIHDTYKREKIVVELDSYIREWLDKNDKEDAVRIICGGPGSGKSSFVKMFAASITDTHDVLFIPLHQLDLRRDVKEVVGDFLISNRIFHKTPIGETEQLLIIFDGLDEIMQQGKACLDAARDFVSQTQQLLRDHNFSRLQLRIIIAGRDLPVQAIEANFRKREQILHVLPYYTSDKESREQPNDTYIDPNNLIKEDKRELWWNKYGELTGKGYAGLPTDLKIPALDEITAQPLLNFLLALSYDRGNIQFSDDTNLNELYDDLVDAVYARGWQSPHRMLNGILKSDYEMVLEEIAVSAWQGTGRTTTVRAIEERCKKSNLENILNEFQDKAQEGVTNLLTAFYFRQSGVHEGDKTFEFTHKSFGEYLAAKKIVRQLRTTAKAFEQQKETRTGWTHEIALENWIQLCSKVPMDKYIFNFLCDEVRRQDQTEVIVWQDMLCDLISHMLRNGMPFDKLPSSFYEKSRQSRNSEEALLAALSACSRFTNNVSNISWPERISAGEWLSKLCGQRTGPSVFALSCLNHLDLSNCVLDIRDLYGANLYHSHLCDAYLFHAVLYHVNLSEADLRRANLREADLSRADLRRANLREADLRGADLRRAYLYEANLRGADLSEADLSGADLRGADLRGAKLDKKYLHMQH